MKPLLRLLFGGWILCAGPVKARETESLAGSWRFRLDELRTGVTEKWYAAALAGNTSIQLPGTMDDAHLGPRNTAPPTLAGPYRLYDYAGPAWYQREVEVPAAWAGQRISLFLERCRWMTSVWLDDRSVGTHDSLIAPHVYDLGTGLQPGKHRLTIRVDNTIKLDLGTFVSALFGGTPGNMNGIIGRIELRSTPPVWIDDVQIYPDIDKHRARVKVRIGNATGRAGQGPIMFGDRSFEAKWNEQGGFVDEMIDTTNDKLWDEFSPNLQDLSLTLGADRRTVRFGMRQFAANGTRFTLNGRPLFLRGTLECSVWPLTGYPPMDVPSWQRIFRILKSYGLNFMRFHSWCPPEAAFAAADIEGIMLQAEGPQANVPAGVNPQRDAFIEEEFKRIVDTYGNHPSFCLMTLGNEYGGTAELLTRWVELLKERDPRHLYSSPSEGQKTPNRQWTELQDGRGIHGPATDSDLAKIVAGDSRPIIGHEIGQWMFYPDFEEMKKYTGVMELKNFGLIRADLAKKHLLDLAPAFQQACGRQAVRLYKEEVEVLRRTPGYAGFSLLDLHDYPTQGTALVGPLDEFWDSKGFISPESYRRFCGPTAPLLRISKRAYTIDEPFTAVAELSHFGPSDLTNVQPAWSITDARKAQVAGGTLATLNVPTGGLIPLGTISASLKNATAPGKLTVTISAAGFSNDWDIWVYPAAAPVPAPADVLVSRDWNDATKSALGQGRKVLLLPQKLNRETSLPGSFLPVFWSPVWFPAQRPNANGILLDPRHPAFSQFPTEMYSDWQWWELLNHSRTLILDDAPADFRPIIQVVDNFARNHKLGNLFEGRVGTGTLLVCTMDLPGLAVRDPAARQLLGSLSAYVASPSFHPARQLPSDLLEKLLVPKSTSLMQKLGARIHADSEAPGHEADLAIDGDPDTFWHTAWEPSPAPMPHELVIDFDHEVTLAGITYLPRRDMTNGRLAECELFANGSRIAAVTWPNNSALQTLHFSQPVTTRSLRLVIKSEVDGHPFASLAEFNVLLP